MTVLILRRHDAEYLREGPASAKAQDRASLAYKGPTRVVGDKILEAPGARLWRALKIWLRTLGFVPAMS